MHKIPLMAQPLQLLLHFLFLNRGKNLITHTQSLHFNTKSLLEAGGAAGDGR